MSYRAYLRQRGLGRAHGFDLPPHVHESGFDPCRKGAAKKLMLMLFGAATGWAVIGGAIWAAMRVW